MLLHDCSAVPTIFLSLTASYKLTYCWYPKQVLAFLEERAAACEQSQSSMASVEKALWGVLRILASNAGSLRASARVAKAKPDEPLGEWIQCRCQWMHHMLYVHSFEYSHSDWRPLKSEER